jgi:hypothetical protein
MVESSVKSISRPVIDRLPVDVNQLDEFACRQLDRVSSITYRTYFNISSMGRHVFDCAFVIIDRFFLQLDRYRRPSSREGNTVSPSSDPSSPTRTSTYIDPSLCSPTPDPEEHPPPKVKLKTKTLDGTAVSDRKDGLGLSNGWSDKGKGSVPSWLEGQPLLKSASSYPKSTVS